MPSTKNILRKIGTESHREELESERLKENYEKIRANDDKMEEERNKSESTKAHERYRRKQKGSENAMSLEGLIKPTIKTQIKPGTYFHGTLKKLAEEFGDIKTMTAYMTMGQLTKYSEKNGCLYNRTGEVVYKEETQECFE
jgi:hypothetical protein|tara:strand:+ start:5727 stop:6149 length:423 start_codon:yes stop_codon:yes gene_type:complete